MVQWASRDYSKGFLEAHAVSGRHGSVRSDQHNRRGFCEEGWWLAQACEDAFSGSCIVPTSCLFAKALQGTCVVRGQPATAMMYWEGQLK